MSSLARRLSAAAPIPFVGGRCAILLAEGDAAKARLLTSSVPELLSRWDGLRPGVTSPAARAAAPFVIRAPDLQTGAAAAAALAQRLSADNRSADAARRAVEGLRAEALALLDESGTRGRIPRLLDRLRAVESELTHALPEEAALAARIDELYADLGATFELERERQRCLVEFARWGALRRLVPDWRRWLAACRAVEPPAQFNGFSADAPRRLAELEVRRPRVESGLRALVQRIGELRRERDAVRIDSGAEPIAADALRLGAELGEYRSRLLGLAGLRARLADLEQGATAALRRLGAEWDEARVAATVVESARADELLDWQRRFRAARAAGEQTDAAVVSARAALDRTAAAARADLMSDAEAECAADDAAWRAVWQLRAALEEIWQVQSRAESRARALRDREAELAAVEAQRRWRPSPRVERRLGTVAVLAGLGGLWGNMTGTQHWQAAALLAVVFGVARGLASLRRRWAAVKDQSVVASCDRLRRDIDQQRRGRDADWSRAAQLTAVIDAAAGRLGLTAPVTLEAVELREQELSTRLRAEGPWTALTQRLVELLRAQEDEHAASAAAAAAVAAQRTLEQGWEAWRAGTDLPPDLDAEHGEEWLARLRAASSSVTSRDAARAALRDSEPAIAAWERDVRALLRRAGLAVADDRCGSALASALASVHDRVQGARAARALSTRLDAELADAERRRAEGEAERDRTAIEWQGLLAASGAADDTALREKVEGFERWQAARAEADRLEAEIDAALAAHQEPTDLRAELARDDEPRWTEEQARCTERIAALDRALGADATRRAALDAALESARGSAGVAALRDEREGLLAEVVDVARRWQTAVLAAALLDLARREQVDAQRHDLLRAASTVLATISAGAYSTLTGNADSLFTIDANGRRTAVSAASDVVGRQVTLSLLLGHALLSPDSGPQMPIVLDDILDGLPATEVALVAEQISALARSQPTIYLTTPERHAAVTAALPGALAVS